MNHAMKLPINIDLSHFREELLTPHYTFKIGNAESQRYRVRKYAENLGGTPLPYTRILTVGNESLFISQLPQKLLELEYPYMFLLELPALDAQDAVLPAHIDVNKTCGINVYLDAEGEVTKFYRWDDNSHRSEYVEEFCASKHDVWLMDTSVPHSVDMVPNKSRRMLTFSFTKAKYEEVRSCFATK